MKLTKERELSELLDKRAVSASSLTSDHELLLLVQDRKESVSLLIVDDEGHCEVPLSNLNVKHPLIQKLSPTEFLICSARTWNGDKNAHVFDRDGGLLRRFGVGDGVANIRFQDGLLWVDHADDSDHEGLFTSVLDGSRERPGCLKTFNQNGYFRRHFGLADIDDSRINVSEHAVFCHGGENVLLKIVDEQMLNIIPAKVPRYGTFAVSGGILWEHSKSFSPYVLKTSRFAFHDDEDSRNARLFHLRDGTMQEEGKTRFESVNSPQAVMSVGSIFHIFEQERWMQFDLDGQN